MLTRNASAYALPMSFAALLFAGCQMQMGAPAASGPNAPTKPSSASTPTPPPTPSAAAERMKAPAAGTPTPHVSMEGDKILLKGELRFRKDYAILDGDGPALLDELYAFLYAHPEIKTIGVVGHCAIGEKFCDPKVDQSLALTRATIPRTEMWKRGLSRDALFPKFDEIGTLHGNVPEADQSKWRIVEFKILARQ